MALLRIGHLFGFIVVIAMATGLLVRSAQAGRLNVRGGVAWGTAFALAMILLALPGLVFLTLVAEYGWPEILQGWHAADPNTHATAILLMVIGAGLAWAARPALIQLDRRLAERG